MGFMQEQVYKGAAFVVETTHGTEVVPVDVCGNHPISRKDELQQYCEGNVQSWELKEGWLARMSAPGYMDCTAWGLYKTEQEATDALREMYGEEDEAE